jgi:hypothetical protein
MTLNSKEQNSQGAIHILTSVTKFVGILYPGYRVSLVTTHKSGYDQFPPAANGWRTIHPIPDMASPHVTEKEGPSTEKELDLGATRIDPPSHRGKHGWIGFHHMSAHYRPTS